MKTVPLVGLGVAAALVAGVALYLAGREAAPARGAQAPVNAPGTSNSQPSEQPDALPPNTGRQERAGAAGDGAREEVANSAGDAAIVPLPEGFTVQVDNSHLLDMALNDPALFDAKSREWTQDSLKSTFDALNAILTAQVEGKVPEGEQVLKPTQIEQLQQQVGLLASRIVH